MKSFTPVARVSVAMLLGSLILSGCSTLIKQSYEGDPATSDLKVSAYSGSTAVYGSTDPVGDGRRLVSDEYARLGSSSFTTSRVVKFRELQSEADDVGADIVLFSARISGSRQYLQPVALNDAGSRYTLAPYVHASESGPAAAPYGGAPQQMAAGNGQEYDYLISFWRKAPKG
jgi:hypothetical protein